MYSKKRVMSQRGNLWKMMVDEEIASNALKTNNKTKTFPAEMARK